MSAWRHPLLPALAIYLFSLPFPGRALEPGWQETVGRLGADSFEEREAAEARLRDTLTALEKAGQAGPLGETLRGIEQEALASGEEGILVAARRVIASFRPGGLVWCTEPDSLPGQMVSIEATPKGILVSGTDQDAGWLALHDAGNGKLLWRRSTTNVENPANLLFAGMAVPPPVVSGETVFVRGTRAGRDHVEAFRLADGAPLWTQPVPAGSGFVGLAREGVIAAGWMAVEAPKDTFTQPKPPGSAAPGGAWVRLLDPRDGRTAWAKEFPRAAVGGIPGEFRISPDGTTILGWQGITLGLLGQESLGLPLIAVRARDGSLAWRQECLPGGATASGPGPCGAIALGGLRSSDFVELSVKLEGIVNALEDLQNAEAWIEAYDPANGRKTLSVALPARETPVLLASDTDGIVAVTTLQDEMAPCRCRMHRFSADGKPLWNLPLKGFDAICRVWETPEGFFVLGVDESGSLRVESRSLSDGSRLSTIDLSDFQTFVRGPSGVLLVDLEEQKVFCPVPEGIFIGISGGQGSQIALYRTADPTRK